MEQHLHFATSLADILDNKFKIGEFRFGLDAFIDLIPYGGDLVILLLSCYIIWVGVQMDIPQAKINRMVGNAAIGFIIGLIPVIGDIVYLLYKPNLRNAAILHQYARFSHS